MDEQKKIYETLGLAPSSLKIAFQGNLGSFSEIALREFFGNEVQAQSYPNFDEAYVSLLNKESDFGILPLENSLIGTIHMSIDVLVTHRQLEIVADSFLRIEQNLLGMKGAKLEDIRDVYSQPPGLDQCKEFLSSHKDWQVHTYNDTAAAARYVAEQGEKSRAAIASKRAAEVYGLDLIAENIETNHNNYTRFAVVMNKESEVYTRYDVQRKKRFEESQGVQRGWLVFSTKDESGALLKCLSVFDLFNINLHKIESRPIIGKPWEYQFTVELDLSGGRPEQAIQTLAVVAKEIHVVGLY